MKVFFRNIHLYLSLAAGLVIMTCCFTGAILVFEKELQELFNHGRYYVKQGNLQLPLEQLIENVKLKYPAAKVASVKVYPGPERSVEIAVSIPEKRKGEGEQKREGTKKLQGRNKEASAKSKGLVQNGEKTTNVPEKNTVETQANEGTKTKSDGNAVGGRPTHTAFVHPYTGDVIELYNYRETFFYTMFSLHRWLLGGDSSIGKTITGVATFIFLFILITGIILWWPKNKAILIKRLKIKTNASWKRLNHDLHIVIGFYSSIFLFIFAFTALAWSFKWFNEGIYTVTKSSMKPAEPPHSIVKAGKKAIGYDSAFIAINKQISDVQYYNLRAPGNSTGVFSATVLPLGAHEGASDNYYIDQYSGQVIGSLAFKDKNLGQRVRSTFKPVHTGSIYGYPTKIIAFLACVLGVTFPITGTIMWINRLRKKKKNVNDKVLSKQLVVDDDDDDEV